MPETLIENLWYAEIYKIASCSRKGGQAPGQLAYWSGFPDPPWRGDYHTNINIQEVYWPIYTANRPELGWPFYDLYLNMLDYIVEDTERYTGMPGARFVRGHGRSGRPHGRGAEWELWPGAGAWLCAHFWWHFQFTRDETFLRDSYRMMRACLDYFVAYVGEPDENGRYHIVPSVCHEQERSKHHQCPERGQRIGGGSRDGGKRRDGEDVEPPSDHNSIITQTPNEMHQGDLVLCLCSGGRAQSTHANSPEGADRQRHAG